jgi:hypothetical protein
VREGEGGRGGGGGGGLIAVSLIPGNMLFHSFIPLEYILGLSKLRPGAHKNNLCPYMRPNGVSLAMDRFLIFSDFSGSAGHKEGGTHFMYRTCSLFPAHEKDAGDLEIGHESRYVIKGKGT